MRANGDTTARAVPGRGVVRGGSVQGAFRSRAAGIAVKRRCSRLRAIPLHTTNGATPEHLIAPVEDHCLTGRSNRPRAVEGDVGLPAACGSKSHGGGRGDAAVAHHHLDRKGLGWPRTIGERHRLSLEAPGGGLTPGANHEPVRLQVQPKNVEWLRGGDADASSLPDGVMDEPPVVAEDCA